MDADEKDIELKKLALERTKASLAAMTVAVSVISAAATLILGGWTVHRAAQDQLTTKLAEITFSTDYPDVSAGKASALGWLFADRLSPELLKKLDDYNALRKQLSDKGGASGDAPPSVESQKELLRLVLASPPSDEKHIVGTWKRMFPGDSKWVDEFAATQQVPAIKPSK